MDSNPNKTLGSWQWQETPEGDEGQSSGGQQMEWGTQHPNMNQESYGAPTDDSASGTIPMYISHPVSGVSTDATVPEYMPPPYNEQSVQGGDLGNAANAIGWTNVVPEAGSGAYNEGDRYNESVSNQHDPYTYPPSGGTEHSVAQSDAEIPYTSPNHFTVPQPSIVQQPYENPSPSVTEPAYPGSTTPQMTDLTQAQGGTEFAIRCDNCNTILTGAHAVGNLTRHKRSLKCGSSGQRKDYACPRCGKVYHRSDALLNHNRKHHGAPPGAPRYPGQSPES